MPEDREEKKKLLQQVKVYPFSQADNPQPRKIIMPKGKDWMGASPVGMKYWQLLSDTINREPVQERGRFIMAILKPLGIEKGKPFAPNWRQQRILMEASIVGEAMAKANDFSKRVSSAHYRDGSNWEYAVTANPDQRDEFYDHLDERAAWFYEAVTNDLVMHGHRTAKARFIWLPTRIVMATGWMVAPTMFFTCHPMRQQRLSGLLPPMR